MKKLLMTTLLASTIASGFAMNAEAAEEKTNTIEPSYKVYAKVHTLQLEDKEIETILNKVMKFYNLKLPTEAQLKEILNDLVEKKQLKYPLPKQEEPKVEVPAPAEEKETEQKEEQPKENKEEKKDSNQPKQQERPEVTPPQQTPGGKEQPKEEQQQNSNVSQEEQQMIDLVNEERAKRGLAPLKVNEELTKVARIKAQDMITNNYFSHQSPTYGSPFDMLNQFGISYRTAGENLAGNQTVEAAHQALMNSDGHRANILGQNYTEIGIGIVNGGPYGKMFVQLFKG